MTKHFLKVLIIFLIMIFLGLVGIFVVNSFDQENAIVDINN